MWHPSIFPEMVYRIVFYNSRRYDVVRFLDDGLMVTLMWRYTETDAYPDIKISERYFK